MLLRLLMKIIVSLMNIEKTISEHAVSDILTPMLASQDRIVTEDVAPLFDQATGLDTPPASGTVTTTIEESRSVITAIIRKAWTAPMTMLGGASVISYIAAAYTYLRQRLQGNETYGIPDRRSEISASSPLAANLALLNDRKISGAIGAPDGISFAQLVGSSDAAASVTEITDDNTGWTMDKANSLYDLINRFPNAAQFEIRAKNYTVRQWPDNSSITRDVEIWMYGLESILDGDNLPLIGGNNSSGITGGKLHLPDVKTMNQVSTARVMLNVSYLYLEGFEYGVYRIGGHAGYTNTRTQYIYLGCKGSKTSLIRAWNYDSNSVTTDIELRNGACQSVTLQNCNGLTAENMYNHILCRLKQDEAGCGSGVTITLGTTNIEKLEAVEEYNTKLTELEDTYGYTFA